MAVRRLAEKQPESFVFTAENAAWAKAQIAKYPQGREASAVIPLVTRAKSGDERRLVPRGQATGRLRCTCWQGKWRPCGAWAQQAAPLGMVVSTPTDPLEPAQPSRTVRKPRLPVELSGLFALRAATR